jgi:hypothetical protein
MTFQVMSHRTSQKHLEQLAGTSYLLDLTSRGKEPWIRFSPFYPHGDIPVPFSPSYISESVEGIWQGLKVFETSDVDPSKFLISNMKGIKRSTKRYGKILGHRNGINGNRLLPYVEARRAIYLPAYLWILSQHLQGLLIELKQMEQERSVIFLDYETNTNIENATRPLSHAGLVKAHLEGLWPS